MRYELYIRISQMSESADRLSLERALTALSAAGFGEPDALPAEMDLGQGRLVAEAFARESGGEDLDGINLSFPLGLEQAQGERAVTVVFALGRELGAEVFDPQLGSLVGASDHERIIGTWRRSYEFQSDVVGAVGLGHGAPAPLQEPRGLVPPRIKLVLFLGLVILVLVFMFRSCFANWMERQFAASLPSRAAGR